MQDDYLQHYGIKGMHWGIRRFQNADGSLTSAGKKRYGSGEGTGSERKERIIDGRKIAKGAVMAASIAGAAYLYSKNRTAVNAVIKKMAKNTATNFVKGAKEGLEAAPYKMGKAIMEGTAYIAGSYAISKAIGAQRQEESIKSYNAYNKKNKIGKVTPAEEFFKGYGDGWDDDDDD